MTEAKNFTKIFNAAANSICTATSNSRDRANVACEKAWVALDQGFSYSKERLREFERVIDSEEFEAFLDGFAENLGVNFEKATGSKLRVTLTSSIRKVRVAAKSSILVKYAIKEIGATSAAFAGVAANIPEPNLIAGAAVLGGTVSAIHLMLCAYEAFPKGCLASEV